MSNSSQVALEMLHIHRIKPDQGRIQSNIQFSQLLSQNKGSAMLCNDTLELVQCTKDGYDILVILCLVRCKPGFVNTCVDI